MKTQILKSVVKNNKVIAILLNEFNNLHIAIWDGSKLENPNQYYLPLNFKMTGSYGKNINDKFLQNKFNYMVNNSFLPNFELVK